MHASREVRIQQLPSTAMPLSLLRSAGAHPALHLLFNSLALIHSLAKCMSFVVSPGNPDCFEAKTFIGVEHAWGFPVDTQADSGGHKLILVNTSWF